jgi:hypothetical protein
VEVIVDISWCMSLTHGALDRYEVFHRWKCLLVEASVVFSCPSGLGTQKFVSGGYTPINTPTAQFEFPKIY